MTEDRLEQIEAGITPVPVENFWIVRRVTGSGIILNADGIGAPTIEIFCEDMHGIFAKLGLILDPNQLASIVHAATEILVEHSNHA